MIALTSAQSAKSTMIELHVTGLFSAICSNNSRLHLFAKPRIPSLWNHHVKTAATKNKKPTIVKKSFVVGVITNEHSRKNIHLLDMWRGSRNLLSVDLESTSMSVVFAQ
jgi:hypothetical protein